MGRFIVLFLTVGAVAMFLLAMNTPPQVIRDSYLYQRYVAGAEVPVEELEPEPVSVRTPARRSLQTTRTATASPAVTETTPAAEPLSVPRIEYPGGVQGKTPMDMVSVNTDALVYSSNSTNAPILKVLNKGQVVEVDMEFISPGGKWALVTIPNEQISGFVRTDGLVLRPRASSNSAASPAVPDGAQ
jgi:hypothetical protein